MITVSHHFITGSYLRAKILWSYLLNIFLGGHCAHCYWFLLHLFWCLLTRVLLSTIIQLSPTSETNPTNSLCTQTLMHQVLAILSTEKVVIRTQALSSHIQQTHLSGHWFSHNGCHWLHSTTSCCRARGLFLGGCGVQRYLTCLLSWSVCWWGGHFWFMCRDLWLDHS